MGKMKPLPKVLNGVRIIKDLGVDYLNERSRTKTRNAVVECPNCKEQRTINIYPIRCGQSNGWCAECVAKKRTGKGNPGYKHGESSTPTHRSTRTHTIWVSMKQRCLNPNVKDYPKYGGRGIRVCREWMDYEGFKKWAGDRFVGDMTIERLDVNGDYCPENCVVVPHWVQAYNRRNSVKGGLLTYIEIAKRLVNDPPYQGKVRAIAKEFGVSEHVVIHINHPTRKNKLYDLYLKMPNWLKEYYERMDTKKHIA